MSPLAAVPCAGVPYYDTARLGPADASLFFEAVNAFPATLRWAGGFLKAFPGTMQPKER